MVSKLIINVQPCFENTLLCSRAREMNMHANETPIMQIKAHFLCLDGLALEYLYLGKTYRFESLDCNTYNIHFARKSSKASLVFLII
jgi:hypothetical protein